MFIICGSPTTILKDRSCGIAQIINKFYVVVLSWSSTSIWQVYWFYPDFVLGLNFASCDFYGALV